MSRLLEKTDPIQCRILNRFKICFLVLFYPKFSIHLRCIHGTTWAFFVMLWSRGPTLFLFVYVMRFTLKKVCQQQSVKWYLHNYITIINFGKSNIWLIRKMLHSQANIFNFNGRLNHPPTEMFWTILCFLALWDFEEKLKRKYKGMIR